MALSPAPSLLHLSRSGRRISGKPISAARSRGELQRLDGRRRGVVFPGEQGRNFSQNTFSAPAGSGHIKKELPVVAVRQYHKQRGEYYITLVSVAAGPTVEPAPEVWRVGFQRFALHRRGKVHVAQRTQPV